MNKMEIRDLIIAVGNRLEWQCRRRIIGADEGCVECGSGPGPEVVWPANPIVFAAYAKAELVWLGWTPQAEGTTCGYTIELFDEYGELAHGDGKGHVTKGYDYNPRDPIAEAIAILRCCDEALRISTANQDQQTEEPTP